MNWLAHAFLSIPDPEPRLGNLIADLISPADASLVSPAVSRGLRQHRIIDQFTDGHALVKTSRRRLAGHYSHGRSILVDIFYDHFLAINWHKYSPETLDHFTSRVYEEITPLLKMMPDRARWVMNRMIEEDWLAGYQTIEGVESGLRRVSNRLSPRVREALRLDTAISELSEHFAGLEEDFSQFFPLLHAFVERDELTK